MISVAVITPLALHSGSPGADPARLSFFSACLNSVSQQILSREVHVTQVVSLSGRDRDKVYRVIEREQLNQSVEVLDLGKECVSISPARNLALASLPEEVDYIMLLDSDDTVPPQRLHIALHALQNNIETLVAASAEFDFIDSADRSLDFRYDKHAASLVHSATSLTSNGWRILPTLDKARCLNLCGLVVSASRLKEVQFRSVTTSEDMWLYSDLFSGIDMPNRICILDNPKARGRYRLHAAQFTAAGKSGDSWEHTSRAIEIGRDAVSSLIDRKMQQSLVTETEAAHLIACYDVVVAVRCRVRAEMCAKNDLMSDVEEKNRAESVRFFKRAGCVLSWEAMPYETQRLVELECPDARSFF